MRARKAGNIATTNRGSVFAVPFRHSSWRIFAQLPFVALLGNALFAANPSITLQVSSETAPPAGYAQFKISLIVPQGVTPGAALPVLVNIGGIASQTSVTVAIQ